jgi:hypothetical protein
MFDVTITLKRGGQHPDVEEYELIAARWTTYRKDGRYTIVFIIFSFSIGIYTSTA